MFIIPPPSYPKAGSSLTTPFGTKGHSPCLTGHPTPCHFSSTFPSPAQLIFLPIHPCYPSESFHPSECRFFSPSRSHRRLWTLQPPLPHLFPFLQTRKVTPFMPLVSQLPLFLTYFSSVLPLRPKQGCLALPSDKVMSGASPVQFRAHPFLSWRTEALNP